MRFLSLFRRRCFRGSHEKETEYERAGGNLSCDGYRYGRGIKRERVCTTEKGKRKGVSSGEGREETKVDVAVANGGRRREGMREEAQIKSGPLTGKRK
jgi:hypothetical protein